MIKEAILKILELAPRQVVKKDDRQIVLGLDGKIATVIRDGDGAFRPPSKTGTVESFCSHVKRFFRPETTTVVVGPDGCTATEDVDESAANAQAITLPFFDADLPPTHAMSHEAFLDYLDQHVPDDGDISLLDILRSITVEEGETVKFVESGAAINVEVSAKKGVQGATTALPKFITLSLRRGTREYILTHKFRLRVSDIGGKQLSFRLIHLNRDGAEDEFILRCLTDIKTTLGAEWHIIQGA